ncbi:MAG: DNA polymerase III subunit alpha [Bacteroidales bacterium]|nr:DNA polymerase III subunit alpha [Bacteroidales bacterium]
MAFAHLHVHTYYSVLDGQASIKSHFKKAQENGQTALAITDHGNMFGVKEFFKVAKDFPDIKPIIGCEVYVNRDGRFTKRGKEDQGAYHLILLAKNLKGYYNLVKIVSIGYTEGFYYKPKIDREVLEKYHENLICCSACLGGEIPKFINTGNLKEAEETALWYKNLFGEDYYLEVQLHVSQVPGMTQEVAQLQQQANEEIFKMSQRLGIKTVATNDAHFSRREDGPAHDRLICLTTNANYSDTRRMRYTQEEYLKTEEEMRALFPDHPEAIDNTMEIVDKIERYKIDRDHVLPLFPIPDEFQDSNDYLRHLVYKGAEKKYKTITDECRERIDFELGTIKRMGFPDYFLIVQDFIAAARGMGVWVGPGRGSAAGSVVAYCLGITNLDPIKYDLLFERFLNPDRISMPDIDVDFDDDGRGKVLNYVEEKYGKDHVSHVVTFGTMATKSAIKDLARIHEVPLQESDRLTKLVPDKFPEEEEKYVDENGQEKVKTKKVKVTVENCIKLVPEIKEAFENSEIAGVHDTLEYAKKLEGTVRNTGVHACAIIIGRDNLTDHIPISIAKDKETGEDMWVSQYEGSFIEDVGMLKMDFLGLRTLSILKEAVSNVKKRHGIDIDIEAIPIDDKKTFELFGRGDTVAVFQFESPGMQKWLRELQPSRFEDLIAMNALYRPGPMDYIPDFVARKKGEQAIEYDLPQMEEILQDTYGVTVYQEQVMLLSQKLANFTKGMADGLRKAMGKKLIDKMMELKVKFMEGGEANGHPQETLEKIWKDWTAFAQYAFNKSHATCYAWVAYQTGYMKAHYPAEFMAANLTKNINNMDEITKLVGECNRMGIQVLGPDINESSGTFSVNKAGNVRYGMAGVKGVGAAAIDAIVDIRGEKPFEGIFDFAERIAPVNNIGKKIIESLAYVGAFDSFPEITRPQFFMENSRGDIFVDALMKYAQKLQTDQFDSQNSLFGGLEESVKPTPPEIPASREYNKMEFLKKEKELVGKYLSAHPLDMYKFEIENFVKQTLSQIQELEAESGSRPDLAGKELYVAAIVSKVAKKMGKDKPFMDVEFEDYSGSYSHRLFSKDYEKYMSYMQEGNILYIKFALVPPFIKNDDKQEKPKVLPCKLRIKRVALLANTKEEFVKGISVTIPVTRFNADFNKALVNALKSNKGEKTLNLHVIDYVNKMQVKFFSRKFKVDITEDFITFLQLNSLDYKVNMDLKF